MRKIGPRAGDVIQRHGIIVVMAEMTDRICRRIDMGSDGCAAGIQMAVHGRDQFQAQLRMARRQIPQLRQIGVGQVGTGHDDQGEIGIGLGQPAGQRQGGEPQPPAGQPSRVIQKGAPFLDPGMVALIAAQSDIGKPAQAQHLHPHQRILAICASRQMV